MGGKGKGSHGTLIRIIKGLGLLQIFVLSKIKPKRFDTYHGFFNNTEPILHI